MCARLSDCDPSLKCASAVTAEAVVDVCSTSSYIALSHTHSVRAIHEPVSPPRQRAAETSQPGDESCECPNP
jgi:hypothetical protein